MKKIVEHEVCKGCKWNNYPICNGTIMPDGEFMNIENLNPGFQCGVKDMESIKDYSIRTKSEVEEIKEKMAELEDRINSLESG